MRVRYVLISVMTIFIQLNVITCQAGPDPWNSDNAKEAPSVTKRKTLDLKSRGGIGEWSFKRILAIILKPNKNKNVEDDSIEIHLQMKFSPEKWRTIEEYLKSDGTFSEDMFRRTLGYVEEAIYKPTFKETIAMAWTDYVLVYLTEYKRPITWTLSSLAAAVALLRLWNKLTAKHVKIIAFILLYFYEGVISYMEAEQKEFQKFISAVNNCKWYFWISDCNVQPSDFISFWKYMNPVKIAIRMVTNWISEPIICLSSILKTMINDITDGLWFPFDKIVYVGLIIGVYFMLISLVITVTFNYIFNIPFKLNFLYGFGGIHIPQRNRTDFPSNRNDENHNIPNTNSIDRATLDRILDICTHAVQAPNVRNMGAAVVAAPTPSTPPRMTRSASTGRLPNLNTIETNNHSTLSQVRHRNV